MPTILQTRHTRVARTAMAIAGVLIMVGSAPDFVRGNTDGDALHDLRHLAIWQAAVGVTVVSAAVTFRLSRLVAVMLVTFLGLTLVAAGYDLVTGHRGPWTDPTHMMEVVAGVLLLRVAWPYVRPGGSGRLSARRTADNRA